MISIREKAAKLMEYAELDGTEVEEVCDLLCKLACYSDYMTNEFHAALEKEIDEQYASFKENFKIVERTETYTRKVKDLEPL